MKKYQKILAFSALFLLSTQGVVVNASEVFQNNQESNMQSDFFRKELPRVSVSINALPKKHTDSPFRDISQSIFKNHINWIYGRGITTGYTPTTYNPEAKVTRGEMATFLNRLAGSPSYKAPFNVYTDVTQYKNQILWLTATTVSYGTAPHYNPNGKVTRGQMAAFLHRMAKVSGNAPTSGKYSTNFLDVQNNMFKNDIGWLSSKGITTGYTPTSFQPDSDISRGEMAAFIYRFYNVIMASNITPPPAATFTGWVKNRAGQIVWSQGGFATLEEAASAAAAWANAQPNPEDAWSSGAY
ncbi:S-layer homology domain-containing protein [Lactococcus petauri]|nr:S-layer homology domain-containing protein [Lactococcus petauri]